MKKNTFPLKEILRKHDLYTMGLQGGRRADLSGADLSGANLVGANLDGTKGAKGEKVKNDL